MKNAKSHPLNDIRLRWVISDPSSERAVDPLGMGAQADKIADFLLPQISVATTRARYFSFLCWAVKKSVSSAEPLSEIHHLEAVLAVDEALHHQNDFEGGTCPDVVGRGRAAAYLKRHAGNKPARPERLYKNTAFATYRPAMRALGLLTNRRSPELTVEGNRLAEEYTCRGRESRCLCNMGSKERTRIRVLLGLDYRKQEDVPIASQRRRATFEVLHKLLDDDNDAAAVLEEFAEGKRQCNEVTDALHSAFVWELLSEGLALAFSMLLAEKNVMRLANVLRLALRSRPRRPSLGPLSPNREEASGDFIALLRAAIRFQPEKLKLDPSPFQLARWLVVERKPIEFLQRLVERHHLAKPDAPWIRLSGEKIHIMAPQKSLAFEVRPRSYRLDAFKQLLRDLGSIR